MQSKARLIPRWPTIRESIIESLCVLAAVGLLVFTAPPPAAADVIVDDPEIQAELPAIDAANPAGTTNLTAVESGFTVVPPGQILDVVNNTGVAVSGFTFTLTGTVAPADANGVLTCRSVQGFSSCSVSSANGTASDTTGPNLMATLSMPGAAPWTIGFTFASLLAPGAHFELAFRSFNTADALTTVPELGMLGPMALFGAALVSLGATVRVRRRFSHSV
jgi:hypothetical protein